jgi:hypothetical protein
MFHWPSLVFDPRHLQFLVTVSQFRILLFLPIFTYIRNEWPYLEYVRPPGRFIFGSCYLSVDVRLALSNPYLEYGQPCGWLVLGNCVVTWSISISLYLMFHWPSLVFDPRHLQFLVTVSQFQFCLPIFMYIRNEWPYLEYVRPPGRFIFGSWHSVIHTLSTVILMDG